MQENAIEWLSTQKVVTVTLGNGRIKTQVEKLAESRQAAIDALKGLPTWWADGGGYYGGAQPPMVALLDPEDAVSAIENLPSVQPQPEEDCATCKHGYFGDRQCDNCRVRYPSHYERRTDE